VAAKTHSIFDPAIIVPAIGESFKKLNPRHMIGNPVMFVTEVGAVITTVLMFSGGQGASFGFLLQITLWLWFTVLFANFAEAMAEGRGKGPGGYPPQGQDRDDGQPLPGRRPGGADPVEHAA